MTGWAVGLAGSMPAGAEKGWCIRRNSRAEQQRSSAKDSNYPGRAKAWSHEVDLPVVSLVHVRVRAVYWEPLRPHHWPIDLRCYRRLYY